MAAVVTLDGRAVETKDLEQRSKEALAQLRQLVADVEAGKLVLDEEWLLIYQKRSNRNAGYVSTHSLDGGLTLAEAVNLMEQHKFDLMVMSREAFNREA